MPFRLIAVGAVLLLSACARRQEVAAPAPVPPANASAGPSIDLNTHPVRWSGNLQPTTARSGGLEPQLQTKAFGTVSLTASGPRLDRTKVNLTVSAPVNESAILRWAVLPGRCGSGNMPLAAVEQFPPIEVGRNGRGQVDAEIPVALPATGALHVNVYWRGQQLSDVMTCANLKLGENR